MSFSRSHARLACQLAIAAGLGAAAGCGSDPVQPTTKLETLQLSSAQIKSLDSTGTVIVQANPANGTLRSLVDSTLQVLTVGIVAQRLDVTTTLTSEPMYFVAVHRVVTRPSGSFSTWTLVGFDNPSTLKNLVEVSGFAQSATTTAPTSVSGTIGDGSGLVNALLLQVGSGGAATMYPASSGTVTFTSGTAGAACPNWVAPNPGMTCALETIRVKFNATMAGGRFATLPTEADVPTMRLTYTGP